MATEVSRDSPMHPEVMVEEFLTLLKRLDGAQKSARNQPLRSDLSAIHTRLNELSVEAVAAAAFREKHGMSGPHAVDLAPLVARFERLDVNGRAYCAGFMHAALKALATAIGEAEQREHVTLLNAIETHLRSNRGRRAREAAKLAQNAIKRWCNGSEH